MDEANKPPRVVGKVGATLMSVNGMIGAGIFALPAILYSEVGNFAPWLFLIFGLLFAANTLICARLSNMFRSSGGAQLWVQAAFGPLAGFLAGFVIVLAQAAGRAATLYVLVSYLAVLFPVFAEPAARAGALAFLLVALTGLTISGMKNSVGGLAVGTVIKIAPILILCLFAFASGGVASEFALPSFGKVESVALLVFFAFSGANVASSTAGELKNPRRDLPITMLASLALIILFYMMVQWAYIAAGAPQGGENDTPLAAAAAAVMGPTGAVMLSIAAIFSVGANALTFVLAGSRITYAMADRGLLPATLAHVSPRFGTPDRAILFFAALIAIMLASGAFTFLAMVTSLGGNLVLLGAFAAFVVLMKRGNHRLTVFWLVTLAVAIAFAIFAAMQAPLRGFLLLGGLLAVGGALYFITRRNEVTAPHAIFD